MTDEPLEVDNITVTIEPTGKLNASYTQGGQYSVTRGLLRAATKEQLKAILAHEIAHHELRHPEILASHPVWVPGDVSEEWKRQLALQQVMSLKRKHELEADLQAVRILERVGSSGEVLEHTLQWLKTVSREPDRPPGVLTMADLVASHPPTEGRIAALRECIYHAICGQLWTRPGASQPERLAFAYLFPLERRIVAELPVPERRHVRAAIIERVDAASESHTVRNIRGVSRTLSVRSTAEVYANCSGVQRRVVMRALAPDDPVILVLEPPTGNAITVRRIEIYGCKDGG
ncbi:MAG TPA: M48 family metalloprotease [Methylomirabilota bacterium]|nr:M48 family metalloprotease [Methylomirabilota bacterium]